MDVGISTACYYPLETEKSLAKLCKAGVKTVEIFFNSISELKSPIIDEIRSIADCYGITVNSVHPFLSYGESYLVFSEYYRRFLDSVEDYKRFFEVAKLLGSGICVIHGERTPCRIEEDEYFERFSVLSDEAKRFGVTITQENVVNFRSSSIDFLMRMREKLGEKYKLTFDIKQAKRSGVDPLLFARRFGNDIVNIHISDHTEKSDCIPPLDGGFDFSELFSVMRGFGYDGNYIIELYRCGFNCEYELMESYKKVVDLLNASCKF